MENIKNSTITKKVDSLPLKMKIKLNKAFLNQNQIKIISSMNYKRVHTESPFLKKKKMQVTQLLSLEGHKEKNVIEEKIKEMTHDNESRTIFQELARLYEEKNISINKLGNMGSIFNPSILLIENKYIGDYLSERFTSDVKEKCLKDLSYVVKIKKISEKGFHELSALNPILKYNGIIANNNKYKLNKEIFKGSNIKSNIEQYAAHSSSKRNISPALSPKRSFVLKKNTKNSFIVPQTDLSKSKVNNTIDENNHLLVMSTKDSFNRLNVTSNIGNISKTPATTQKSMNKAITKQSSSSRKSSSDHKKESSKQSNSRLTKVNVDLEKKFSKKGRHTSIVKHTSQYSKNVSENNRSIVINPKLKQSKTKFSKNQFNKMDMRLPNLRESILNNLNINSFIEQDQRRSLYTRLNTNNSGASNADNIKDTIASNEEEQSKDPLVYSISKKDQKFKRRFSRNKKLAFTNNKEELKHPVELSPDYETKKRIQFDKINTEKHKELSIIFDSINKKDYKQVQSMFQTYSRKYFQIEDFDSMIKK